MKTETVAVRADFRQFYIYGADDFDASTVDELTDGLLAPRGGGARVGTISFSGDVPVEVRVVEGSLALPDDAVVASASNLRLSAGEVTIDDFGGPARFRHRFEPSTTICSVLVERVADPERFTITFSPQSLTPSRWRSAALAALHPDLPDQWPDTVDLALHEDDGEGAFLDFEPGPIGNRLSDADIEALIWGGRAPSGPLLDIGDVAAGIAGTDRPFADRLAAAPASTQRRIAVDLVVSAGGGYVRRPDVEAVVQASAARHTTQDRHSEVGATSLDLPPQAPEPVRERFRRLLEAACDPHAGRAAFRTLWLTFGAGQDSGGCFSTLTDTYFAPPTSA